jgi:hypothetical protein
MHSDKLLEVVLDQIQQDIKDGDVTSLFDMLEIIDRDTLVGFLSYSRLDSALEQGLIMEEEHNEHIQ